MKKMGMKKPKISMKKPMGRNIAKEAAMPTKPKKPSNMLAKQGVTGKRYGAVRESSPPFNEGF